MTLIESHAHMIVVVPSGCHIWIGSRTHNGYGSVRVGGVLHRAHKLAYGLAYGPVPDGLVLDHTCRDRACCNPDHVEPVTNQTNCQRGNTGAHNKAKTECPQGHPYDAENTYIVPSTGSRMCKACIRERNRR